MTWAAIDWTAPEAPSLSRSSPASLTCLTAVDAPTKSFTQVQTRPEGSAVSKEIATLKEGEVT